MTRPFQTRPLRALVTASLLQAAAVGSPAPASTSPATAAAWEWEDVPRVVAVGDLHGNYDKLVRLLTAAELIDGERRWAGGRDHLVVAGDFLDRGPDDRPLMDLLRRLEAESVAAGGRVHVLLGNHEVMNLFRDLRYVDSASYRHFAPDERDGERRAAASAFARSLGRVREMDKFREFNREFPAGYFARQRSLGPGGEYGGWLMALPAIVKVNGVAYTHGGLNEEFAGLGVAGINRRLTESLQRYLEAQQVLERDRVVLPTMGAEEILAKAREIAGSGRGARGSKRRQAAEQLLAAAAEPILRGQGPLWYRGNALQDERLERDILDRSLELLKARALVVAHSPTISNRITSRFHGRLFRIDHGIGGNETPLALIAEHGETLVLDSATRETTAPVREHPIGQLGAPRSDELGDEALAEFLSRSLIVESRTLGLGSTRPRLLVLERQGEARRAIFKSVEEEAGADRYQHEVAAYRLDRLLGLGMVPVTVLRTVDGRTGSLQAWVEAALDLETAEGYNLRFFETEGKASQLEQARVFDALIGNAPREPADILGLVRGEKMLLIDHSKAFSTSPEVPPHLRGGFSIPAQLAEALEGLDRRLLRQRLEALLARRDAILDHRRVGQLPRPSRPDEPAKISPTAATITDRI